MNSNSIRFLIAISGLIILINIIELLVFPSECHCSFEGEALYYANIVEILSLIFGFLLILIIGFKKTGIILPILGYGIIIIQVIGIILVGRITSGFPLSVIIALEMMVFAGVFGFLVIFVYRKERQNV